MVISRNGLCHPLSSFNNSSTTKLDYEIPLYEKSTKRTTMLEIKIRFCVVHICIIPVAAFLNLIEVVTIFFPLKKKPL